MQIAIILLLSLLLSICIVLLIIQFKARLKMQKFIVSMFYKNSKALQIMRQLDLRGAFQAHDEVGEAFYLITQTIEELRNYLIENLSRKETSKK